MIDIKDISGNIRFSTSINEGSKRKFLLMKEDYITLKFSLEKPIYFKLGDYVDIPNDFTSLFEVCDIQKPTFNNSTGGYDYELRLDAYYWKWKNKKFKYTPEVGGQEASWNLTASLDIQLGVFLKNLQALGYTYRGKNFEFSIDSTVENKAIAMSYDNINLLDALSSMAQTWECEWWITNSVIHFGRCEYGTPVDFELGKNVLEMTRSDSQTNFATRIYAFGSTRNIPTNYRPVDESIVVNGITQKRLMLPVGTPYIDAYPNMSTEEAVEDIVVFDDVYPRKIGTVSNVTTHEYTDKIEEEEGKPAKYEKWNAYRFKDAGITFSEEYRLSGTDLKLIFQSGRLNGMEFTVLFNPDKLPEKNSDGSWNPAAQVWEIVRNEDYGRPLPDEVLRPQGEHMEGNVLVPADTYILSGFDTKFVSDAMIPTAEQELKEKALKYVEKSKIDPSTYDNKMMFDCMVDDKGNLKMFEVGDRVNLINAAYFETGSRQSRIIGFEYNLDIPYDNPVYTVGETASYSRIGEIENKIENLTYKGQTYTGTGGSGVYVIGTNDSTPASNRNVLSALRSRLENLSRQNDDEASGLIKFLQGLISLGDIVAKQGITVGENGHGITVGNSGIVTAILDELKNIFNIVSPDFVSGDLGNGFILKYDPETGRSYLEIDDLLVRKIAYFVELVIKQLRHVGGEIILTPASMKCNKVEVLADVYRCYFKQDDGDRSITKEFVTGDQARCQTFNIKEGTSHNVKNQYYWRLVTAVEDDYIELSKTDCDTGSGIPAAGDDIVQLGNRNDATRQNAIILSTVGDDAPSFKQYKGINSYSLKGKEVTILSASLNKLIGQFISETTGKSYDDMFSDMQDDLALVREQTDKEYILWFFEYVPTLNNIPASDWNTSELKTMHEQDMFYNHASGLAYRFEKSGDTWTWNNITDQQTIKALENAAKAQDTADNKRRVFVAQPTNAQAYDVGDLWTNATYGELYTNDTLVCKTPKAAGIAFSIDHWKPINTATTAYIENLGNRITLAVTDSNKGIEAAKKLANQGISDAGTAYSKAVAAASAAAGAQGGVNDLNTVVAEHTTVIQQTKDSITALAGKISFDASGKVTNISTSGLVTTADFNTLLSKKVSFDASGKITNISTSGLVTEAAFAGLFSSRVTDEGLVKRADISTFITSDEAGNLISKATIRADQINLTGKLTISMLATDLKSCIDGKADAGDLGGLAYKDAVEKAMLGSTLISGAYLKTELIDVDSLYVKHLKGATGDFTGTLSGVQGTFQSLSSPGGETTMTFANVYNGMLISGDIHHHEHVSFYGKAIFADMSLGYRALAYVKVTGNKAEYYSHGAYTYPVKTLTLRSISMGNYTWYDIPLTPNGAYDDCYNVVYLCNSSGYRYIFSENYAGNVFYLVNTNNNIANIYYCNSGAVNISGGQVHTLMKAPREYLNPAVGTVYGAGLICVSTFDNNW